MHDHFNEMLHTTISLVKQELLYGRKMSNEHKVSLRAAAFSLSQMQRVATLLAAYNCLGINMMASC